MFPGAREKKRQTDRQRDRDSKRDCVCVLYVCVCVCGRVCMCVCLHACARVRVRLCALQTIHLVRCKEAKALQHCLHVFFVGRERTNTAAPTGAQIRSNKAIMLHKYYNK